MYKYQEQIRIRWYLRGWALHVFCCKFKSVLLSPTASEAIDSNRLSCRRSVHHRSVVPRVGNFPTYGSFFSHFGKGVIFDIETAIYVYFEI